MSHVTRRHHSGFLPNSSLTCKPNSTLSWTEKKLTLFSHVSTLPWQPLHIVEAELANRETIKIKNNVIDNFRKQAGAELCQAQV